VSGRGAFLAAALLTAAVVSGCGGDETAAAPEPREPTREAIGHYCNMIVVDHRGPKGQIFLKGRERPLWFSSVRDTVAFTMLPEEPKDIAAIYVNDIARASWDMPEPGTWIDARGAWYAIESGQAGGMGAPEAVPFSDRAAAEAFTAAFGGRVVAFDDIPEGFILGGVDDLGEHSPHDMPAHNMAGGEDHGGEHAQ